jgi:hypothetical protein
MQNSSDEKHIEDEVVEDSEENNVLIEKEIEASAPQGEEVSEIDEFGVVLCSASQTVSYVWNTAEVQNFCCYEKKSL